MDKSKKAMQSKTELELFLWPVLVWLRVALFLSFIFNIMPSWQKNP